MLKDSDYRECPFCAELIKAKAVKCKHCKSFIDAAPAIKTPAAVITPAKEKTSCPECREEIYVGATKCRYCKASIITDEQQKVSSPQSIDQPLIDLHNHKPESTISKSILKTDQTYIDSSKQKQKIASAFSNLTSKIDLSFIKNNKRRVALSVVGLFAVILIVYVSVQFIGHSSDQAADNGPVLDESLAAGSNGELDAHEHEEEIIESPLTIIFANRTVAFEDKKPSSPEEVILVLLFSGVDDATIDNAYLMHNGEKYPFFSGYRGSMGDVLTYMYGAFVPKSALEFELYVGDHPPETVFADEEIQEEL